MTLKFIKAGLACALSLPALLAAQDMPDEPLASRGDVTVTHREFDARMSLIPKKDRAPFLRDSSRLERVLSELLVQKQLAADARAADFDEDELIQLRMKLAADAELARAWLEHYIDLQGDADYEALAHEQYLKDPSIYKTQPSIDVSHILVSTSERDVEAAEALAKDVYAQLEADPDAWDSLVMAHSEDPSVINNGGTFNGVRRGDMVKPFETAAFALESGQISEPVRTQYGFHIIRLDARHESEQMDFESVKNQLVEQQRNTHRERVRVDYLNRLGSVETAMTEEAVLKMLSRYRDAAAEDGQPQNDSE